MKRAFTLIELMVSVTIIIILSGASVVAFLDFNERQKINDDYTNVVAVLRSIYQKAASAAYPENCQGLREYRVTLPSPVDAKGVRLEVVCDNQTTVEEFASVVDGVHFDDNVIFAYRTGSGELLGVSPALVDGKATIDLTSDTDINLKRSVVVSGFGVIW